MPPQNRRLNTYIVLTRVTVEAKPTAKRFFKKQLALEFMKERDEAGDWGSVMYRFASGFFGSLLFPFTWIAPTKQLHHEPPAVPGTGTE